jgi:hypothetical protein
MNMRLLHIILIIFHNIKDKIEIFLLRLTNLKSQPKER